MKKISHRGNLRGPIPELENKPEYIYEAIHKGFEAEIDLWGIENKLYLGHSDPTYEITFNFLKKLQNKLWVHCKNLEALNLALTNKSINCFWHQNDDYTLTSQGYIWTYPDKEFHSQNVIVDLNEPSRDYTIGSIAGICSDYIALY